MERKESGVKNPAKLCRKVAEAQNEGGGAPPLGIPKWSGAPPGKPGAPPKSLKMLLLGAIFEKNFWGPNSIIALFNSGSFKQMGKILQDDDEEGLLGEEDILDIDRAELLLGQDLGMDTLSDEDEEEEEDENQKELTLKSD